MKTLSSKTAENVLDYFANEFVLKYGPPDILITDQGLEFLNAKVISYLKGL